MNRDPQPEEAVFNSETNPVYAPIAAHREAARAKDKHDAEAELPTRQPRKRVRKSTAGTSDGSRLATGRNAGNLPSNTASGTPTSK